MTAISTFGRSTADKADRGEFSGKSFLISVLLGLAAICVVFGVVLQSSYRATEEVAIQASNNIGALVEQNIIRNVDIYNLSLQAAIDGIADPAIMGQEPSLRQLSLFDRSATAKGLGSILILNESGNVVLDSRSTTVTKINFADRQYFQVHRTAPNVGLFVSPPFHSRIRDGDWTIGISRRLSHPDGSFAGVIVGTMSLSYFQDLFRQIDLGTQGAIILFNEDGTILARQPFDPTLIGRNVRNNVGVFQRYKKAPTGHYETLSLDGTRRLFSYRKVSALPLILNVGLSTDEIFAAWWRKALATSATLLGLCGIVVALTLRLGRELRRRRVAEEQLAVLATTDSMTGLANRRKFDERLEDEWARARRAGQTLSLLMLDTDSFKTFNDTYGHQGGDGALQTVARCIQANIRRPADLAARYGGEEFAVLLPDTPTEGAMKIAEAVRSAIVDLAIVHSASAYGRLTASIGVQTLRPMPSDDASRLVRDADRALYIAKSAGRNRVVNALSVEGLIPLSGARLAPDRIVPAA